MPSKRRRVRDKEWSNLYRTESNGIESLSEFRKKIKKLGRKGIGI